MQAGPSITVARFLAGCAFFVVLYGFFEAISHHYNWRATAIFGLALVAGPVLPWLCARSGAKQAASRGRTREVGHTLGLKDGTWASAIALVIPALLTVLAKIGESIGPLP